MNFALDVLYITKMCSYNEFQREQARFYLPFIPVIIIPPLSDFDYFFDPDSDIILSLVLRAMI